MADTRIYLGTPRERLDSEVLAELATRVRQAAEPIAKRTERRKGAPVRAAFVSLPADDANVAVTPALARLLRGGRGGEVKLKVLLTALWIGAAEPYDVTLPGRAWAQLIGLPDPGTRGAHRVNTAIRQLVTHQFLRAEPHPGEATRLFLLEETGSGRDYSIPGRRVVQLIEHDQDPEPHRYFRVPRELWTNGWIAALHGPATAMLLVLLSLTSGRPDREVWFAPSVADRRFHLSAETRKRGVDRLRELGLITVHRRPVAQVLDTTRRRNTYTVHLDVLIESSPTPTPPGI